MFNLKGRLSQYNKFFSRDSFVLHVLPAGAVCVALLGLTLWASLSARQNLATEGSNSASRRAELIEQNIRQRLGAYEVVLRGGAALFLASNDVTREEWKTYVSSFELNTRYPGVQGVGYAAFLQPAQLPALMSSMQAQGTSDFQVYPAGDRDTLSSIFYLEPITDRNRRAIGFDMYSDPVRHQSMDRAIETGSAAISGRVQLVQAESVSQESGFLMYVPVPLNPDTKTADLQQDTVRGLTHARFFSSTFFEIVLDQESDSFIRAYDGKAEESNLLFENKKYSNLRNNKDAIKLVRTMELYGSKWTMEYWFSPSIVAQPIRARPNNTLYGGLIFSILISGLIWTLLVSRTRSLAAAEEREVQAAKDELLSLASHQLRTPATGVKQYIGMLRDGFAGNLDDAQMMLVEKAYESNERQLQIINELLYVAKVDAEGIVLAKRSINIPELITDIAEEQGSELLKHGHKLKLELPKKSFTLVADEHCLRMAIENLLTNAIKYTPDGGKITVGTKKTPGHVMIWVKDNGVGIESDDMPLLFQRFSRIPNDHSRRISGSGIGLYLAQHLVQLHGGEIIVESKPQKGSTFKVGLPTSND